MKQTSNIVFAAFAAAGISMGCSSGSTDNTAANAPAATTGTPPATGGTAPAGAAPAGSVDGATLFAANCQKCHGDKGAGGGKAPKLAGRAIKQDEVAGIVTNGKPPRMPKFSPKLSKDEIDAVAKYVSTL